jgi:hypothetical protein
MKRLGRFLLGVGAAATIVIPAAPASAQERGTCTTIRLLGELGGIYSISSRECDCMEVNLAHPNPVEIRPVIGGPGLNYVDITIYPVCKPPPGL